MINPQPLALQQKMRRLGWGGWIPTPDITDEDKMLYITLGDRHIRIMPCDEALALPDAQLQQQIEWTIGTSHKQACERYGLGHEETIERGGESYQSPHFSGFAELLFSKLGELGLVALVDILNFGEHPELALKMQEEMNQLTKQIFAHAAYGFAKYLFDHVHNDDTCDGMSFDALIKLGKLPDMTEWPGAKEQEK